MAKSFKPALTKKSTDYIFLLPNFLGDSKQEKQKIVKNRSEKTIEQHVAFLCGLCISYYTVIFTVVGCEAIVFRFAVTVSGKRAEVIVVSGGAGGAGGGYKHIVFEDHN